MEEVHKRKSDFSRYLQVSTGALDRWDVVWKPAWGIEENIFSEKEKKGRRLVHVSPLQRAHYRPLSEPSISKNPSCPPSVGEPVRPIHPHWRGLHYALMESDGKPIGIQGHASTMHGHTAHHRQAICCDEEALYTARLCPLGSPSSPTEPNTHFYRARHPHISTHQIREQPVL